MPTLNLQIASSDDDGHSSTDGSFTAVATSAQVGKTNTAPAYSVNSFFRFAAAIPAGATITSAVLSVSKFSGFVFGEGVPLIKVRAERGLSPTAPTSQAEHFSRMRTLAGVDWNDLAPSVGAFSASPDIATVIQEVANLGEVTSLLILLDNNGTPSAAVAPIATYDDSQEFCTKLDIDYTEAGGDSTKPNRRGFSRGFSFGL